MTNQCEWGDLSSKQRRVEFLVSLDSFVNILAGAESSLKDTVVLKECENIDLSCMTQPSDYVSAANSSDTLELIEAHLQIWIKQIEQVG